MASLFLSEFKDVGEAELTDNQLFKYLLLNEMKRRISSKKEQSTLIHSRGEDRKGIMRIAREDAHYPNLKYRKPKYEHVESILKYVETPEEKGQGVKLVIMNFND